MATQPAWETCDLSQVTLLAPMGKAPENATADTEELFYVDDAPQRRRRLLYTPVGIHLNVPYSTVVNGGWIICVNVPYSYAITDADIDHCKGLGPEFMMGAMVDGTGVISLLAAGQSNIAMAYTSSTTVASHHNGAYWYRISAWSVGFSIEPAVSLSSADTLSSNCAYRLSWHINSGGYRAGCTFPSTDR
eukprot:1193350-Prorocentrum_minimum.AAC.2